MTMLTAPQTSTSDPAELAALIHDDILQSLGVAVLGVDLCRRLHQRMRYEQALDELIGIVEALDLALISSERILPELDQIVPTYRPSSRRPSLVVLDSPSAPTAPAKPAAERSATGPREIVDTLAACLVQARRCRGQYDAGLGEETMRDLELMLQRLEFVAVTFRQVMEQLRQLSSHTFMPRPEDLPVSSRPVVVAWTRSA
jgi:hypothetical protein